MYVRGNPKSLKELRTWLKEKREVRIFSPGPFPAPRHGVIDVEGPHGGQHSWYAMVEVQDGKIVAVLA
jgi:hypothetical protein